MIYLGQVVMNKYFTLLDGRSEEADTGKNQVGIGTCQNHWDRLQELYNSDEGSIGGLTIGLMCFGGAFGLLILWMCCCRKEKMCGNGSEEPLIYDKETGDMIN